MDSVKRWLSDKTMALAAALARLSAWLYEEPPAPPPTPDPLAVRADALVAWAETLSETGGEYRRHQVYAKLLREFPGRRRCDLGLAIEFAVQRSRGET